MAGYAVCDVDSEDAQMLEVRTVDSELEMRGALDHDGGRQLLRVIGEIDGDVRIDASQVQRMDGAGLTALAIARQECLANGRSFVLTRIAPEAVRGLRVGEQVAELFGEPQPSAADDGGAGDAVRQTSDGTTDGAWPAGARSRRFRIPFHLHRHDGM
jgi:anti-anti-sigma regulatory factor